MTVKEKPATGPNALDPNSKTQKRIAGRTREGMKPEMFERRDKFVEGMLRGMSKYEAARFAGVPERSAHKEASTMYREPYVQERFKELRELMEEDQLITRKELLLNVKSIAFDEAHKGSDRVSASSLLSQIMGWRVTKISGPNGGPLEINQKVSVDVSALSDEALKELMTLLKNADQ